MVNKVINATSTVYTSSFGHDCHSIRRELASIKRYLMIGVGITGVLHEKKDAQKQHGPAEKKEKRIPITSLATLLFPYADTAAEKKK